MDGKEKEEQEGDLQQQQQQQEEELSNNATLDDYLDLCRRLNNRLEASLDDTTTTNDDNKKSTRLLILIKSLLASSNCKLTTIYASVTNHLAGCATKFIVDLKQSEDDDDENNVKKNEDENTRSSTSAKFELGESESSAFSLSSNVDSEKILKIVKANVEISKLIMDLTTPLDMLDFNRDFIYSALTYFQVKIFNSHMCPFLNELDTESESDEDRLLLSHKDYALYLLKYKELFVKLDLFSTVADNLLVSIRLVYALADHERSQFMKSMHQSSRLSILLVHLVDSILVNICLVRNLLIERNEYMLNLIIARLLENRFDHILNDLSGFGKIIKSETNRNLICFLLTQLNSLIFSIHAKLLNSSSTIQQSQRQKQEENTTNQQKQQQDQNRQQQQQQKPTITTINLNQLRQNLNKYAISMCKSGSFANIVISMLRCLSSTSRNRVHGPQDQDVSYFLWLIKFMVSNFVVKRLEPIQTTSSQAAAGNNGQSNNILVALNDDLFDHDLDQNGAERKKIKSEKTFFNDSKHPAATLTKKTLLSYDLLAFLSFSMLSNFEKLLFDSNIQNMTLLKFFCPNKRLSTETTSKLVNARLLKLFYLSISCIYEVIECINLHLEYLNSAQYLKEKNEDFLIYLNEFIHFEQLKQSFAMFMRFYAYNQHVYSDSLIKTLIICNQHYLNTYKNVYELIRVVKIREHETRHNSNNSNAIAINESSADLASDTNATKNSSTVSSIEPMSSSTNIKKIYDLYANTDTSFILKKVLANFEHNDPALNRSCIDFLDGLMIECSKHENIFHMNLALSLANITLLESFRFLDQRIKDLISSILVEIRCMCKRKPQLANKILFDVHRATSPDREQLKRTNLVGEVSDEGTSNKRSRIELTDSEQSNIFILAKNKQSDRHRRDTKKLRSYREASTSVDTTSSCSSLRSTTSDSVAMVAVELHLSSSSPETNNNKALPSSSKISPPKDHHRHHQHQSERNHHELSRNIMDREIKLLVENEFLFCLRSLDTFNKTKHMSSSSAKRGALCGGETKRISSFISKNDHLYRILKYIIQLFESMQTSAAFASTHGTTARITSWSIYTCLLNMKFEENDDKTTSLNKKEVEQQQKDKKSLPLTSELTLSLEPSRKEFYMSKQYINLRMACSTEEFRRQLKEAYIKYLVETLCIKSKQTRNAIFWLFNVLKKLKLFHVKKSYFAGSSQNSLYENANETTTVPHQALCEAVSINGTSSNNNNNNNQMAISGGFLSAASSSSSSIFEFKLLIYYCVNQMNIPLIPYNYEIQKVFHSVNFAHLLDLLGVVRTDKGFPYVPKEWLNKNRRELNDCLNSIEKCLCI